MSRQNISRRCLSSGVMTGTNTIRSEPMSGQGPCSFHAKWTGTPVGTSFKVYVSDVYKGKKFKTVAQAFTDGEFREFATFGASLPAGSAGSEITIIDTEVGAKWMVFEYVNASGTGVLDVDYEGPGATA